MGYKLFPDWKELVVYGSDGPRPQALTEGDQFKVLVAGLEPGQIIPQHPEGLAVYHFLEGTGWMTVDDESFFVKPGATVITPDGARRGMQAETRLAFLAARVAMGAGK